jgi:hypothetical protein
MPHDTDHRIMHRGLHRKLDAVLTQGKRTNFHNFSSDNLLCQWDHRPC